MNIKIKYTKNNGIKVLKYIEFGDLQVFAEKGSIEKIISKKRLIYNKLENTYENCRSM